MEKHIKSNVYRKLFMLNDLEDEIDTQHELFTYHHNYKYLISGPKLCGKTSLLFEMAFQAAENGLNVLFISCKHIKALPFFHGTRLKPSTEVLDRIQIIYPNSLKDLLKLLSAIHLQSTLYQMVIVDDFNISISEEKLKIVQSCSLLLSQMIDVVGYFSKKTGARTMLLCSMCSDVSNYESIAEMIHRWIPNEIRFYQNMSKQADRNVFFLKTETKLLFLLETADSDVVSIRATFCGDRIMLK